MPRSGPRQIYKYSKEVHEARRTFKKSKKYRHIEPDCIPRT